VWSDAHLYVKNGSKSIHTTASEFKIAEWGCTYHRGGVTPLVSYGNASTVSPPVRSRCIHIGLPMSEAKSAR
jgi:hypothetical protein